MATKTSILIFYLRMSRNTQRLLRVASYATLGVVNIAGAVLTLLNAFQCNPVRAAYDSTVANANCLSIVTLYLCSAPLNIITDLTILVLPIPVLTGMRLPQRQKTILVFTFALGILVTIVDLVRIYYLQKAVDVQGIMHVPLDTRADFAKTASTALMLSAVEVNVGIICACIPTLKPLVKKILPAMITDRVSGVSGVHQAGRSGSYASHAQKPSRRQSVAESNPRLQPLPPAHVEGDHGAEMDMMDFLTIPEGMKSPALGRCQTAQSAATENAVYFGFVNMKKPKSMLKTKGLESFKYCTLVTVLFFLWGFSYGLLNSLNNEITQIAGYTTGETLGLTSAYFGAYFIASPTVGQWTLRKAGFKATFITGLCIYGVGTLMFWPSAVLTSLTGFILSNFIVGFGLAVTETAANPFIALCGPLAYSESRLLAAQGVQAIGSILSQLLAHRVFFSHVVRDPSLIDVQWTFLAIALFTVSLALFFYYMPLPEVTDEDLQAQAEALGNCPSQTVTLTPQLKPSLVTMSLMTAVGAQFFYVGAQESVSVWFGGLLREYTAHTQTPLTLRVGNYGLVGHAMFAVSRFFFAGLCLYVPPRLLLLVTSLGAVVCSGLTMSLPIQGNRIVGPMLVLFYFEGPIWPLIFAMGIRGLGCRTKLGASLLTAAAGGGAVFPFVMLAVQRLADWSIQHSFCVVLTLNCCGILYPAFLNCVPKARRLVDPVKDGLLLPRDAHGRGDRGHGTNTWTRRLSTKSNDSFEKD